MYIMQEVPENGADMSHLNVVHKPAMLSGGKPTEAKLTWGFLTHQWSGSWEANSNPELSHRALMTLTHRMCLFNKIPFMEVNVQAHQVRCFFLLHLFYQNYYFFYNP